MADGSKIEWTNATWNPVTGCTIDAAHERVAARRGRRGMP